MSQAKIFFFFILELSIIRIKKCRSWTSLNSQDELDWTHTEELFFQ